MRGTGTAALWCIVHAAMLFEHIFEHKGFRPDMRRSAHDLPRHSYTLADAPAHRGRGAHRIDAARGLALLGMMATHLLPTFEADAHLTPTWIGLTFSGRAAALFAVLAGWGSHFPPASRSAGRTGLERRAPGHRPARAGDRRRRAFTGRAGSESRDHPGPLRPAVPVRPAVPWPQGQGALRVGSGLGSALTGSCLPAPSLAHGRTRHYTWGTTPTGKTFRPLVACWAISS